jgi:hypothetical protein
VAEGEVFDREGTRWTIRRRWTPRWTRVDVGKRFRQFHRRRSGSGKSDDRRRWWEWLDFPVGDDFGLLVIIGAVIAAVLLLWFAVIPLLLVLVDVLVVVVVFVVGVSARVLLRRPWTVVATRIDGVEIEREVVGWRDSRDEMVALRAQIERGEISPISPYSDSPPGPL